MARRLQSLLFFALIAGLLLALWSWSGGGPEQEAQTHVPTVVSGEVQGDQGIAPGHGDRGPPETSVGEMDARPAPVASPLPEFLPDEARDTLVLIVRNGPFPYRQDGSVFQNRERRLPRQPRGYYREYTVETPGSPDRGARRIVTGGEAGDAPPVEYHYTDDHYRSFRRFDLDPGELARMSAQP
jgi:ribonuclease T1